MSSTSRSTVATDLFARDESRFRLGDAAVLVSPREGDLDELRDDLREEDRDALRLGDALIFYFVLGMYVCGPGSFMDDAKQAAGKAGGIHIHDEVFNM